MAQTDSHMDRGSFKSTLPKIKMKIKEYVTAHTCKRTQRLSVHDKVLILKLRCLILSAIYMRMCLVRLSAWRKSDVWVQMINEWDRILPSQAVFCQIVFVTFKMQMSLLFFFFCYFSHCSVIYPFYYLSSVMYQALQQIQHQLTKFFCCRIILHIRTLFFCKWVDCQKI